MPILRYWRDCACYFEYFGHEWPCPPKLITPTCWKLWSLSACKKPTSSLPSFLRYCKLIILSTWPIPDYGQQKDKISLKKTLMVVFMQKSNLSLTFLEILLRYRNLFRSFRYDWPCPLKLIIPACMKVW